MSIEITVNGQRREFESESTISQLLGQLNLDSRAIAVEVNQILVPRDQHQQTRIVSGDVLEIVTLVGGG